MPQWSLFILETFFMIKDNFFPFLGEEGRETGIWTQGSVLTKQELYHLNNISSSFWIDYFGMGSCKVFAWAGLKLWSSKSQSPKYLGLQTWAWYLVANMFFKQWYWLFAYFYLYDLNSKSYNSFVQNLLLIRRYFFSMQM
jgi:hypothetical protein